MKLVKVLDEKILLLRSFDGRWRALAPTCPHARAPLEKGALCGSRLICPSKFLAAYVREGRCEAVFSAYRESETAKLFDQMQG
jgi:phenylpropionate dioxygenase-like ring-hydroxylating dioxygenase large terminal subunit